MNDQVEGTEVEEVVEEAVAEETVSDAIEEARPEEVVADVIEEPEAAVVSPEGEREGLIQRTMRQTYRSNSARKRDLKTAHLDAE